ncbi:MAG: ABC transporter ATP-binding protein [Helicobacteraceae bacterium]|jgi:sulfonate transport system ATP-binding protein|nr:ABC transporter ATP-binding protein [Helicobacteraceae bacterium]
MREDRQGRLEIRDVTKRYKAEGGGIFEALSNASFVVDAGEFVSIVGPSGCGKTTLLRLIAGLDNDYEGVILLENKRVEGASLDRGIVFQDHRLLPWLTLKENVALSLINLNGVASEKDRIVKEHIELVRLEGFENAYPHQLSGGMAQRAAIARALAHSPAILLLDEPLGALDAITRIRLQEELQRIWRSQGVSMILVTHDVEEAIFLSDKIVVMNANPGRIVEEIKITLPEPRDRAGYEFGLIRRKIFKAMLGDEARRETSDNYAI